MRDVDGFLSNAAWVQVTVNAVADVPLLSVAEARGDQDAAIPLAITAAVTDRDGSESLHVDIADLPMGATLSDGVLVAVGHYRLSAGQLDGLTITPGAGAMSAFELQVTAVAAEPSGGSAAVTQPLAVAVDSVAADPVSISGFAVNDGQAQRSQVHTLAVRFNQDVALADPAADIWIADPDDAVVAHISPERFAYDPLTHTLTIAVQGLIVADGQYVLKLRRLGVASRGEPGGDPGLGHRLGRRRVAVALPPPAGGFRRQRLHRSRRLGPPESSLPHAGRPAGLRSAVRPGRKRVHRPTTTTPSGETGSTARPTPSARS